MLSHFMTMHHTLQSRLLQWLSAIVLLMISLLTVSMSQENGRLEKVGFSTLPGNRVQINLDFVGKAQNPISFSTDNPARIVLDFPGTRLNLSQKNLQIGIGVVQSASAVETSDRTRVVLNLVRMVPFNTQVKGNRVFIAIESEATAVADAQSPPPPPAEKTTIPKASNTPSRMMSANQKESVPVSDSPTTASGTNAPLLRTQLAGPHIQNIDFRRTEEGTGRVIVTMSDPTITVDLREEGKNLVLDFPSTSLPEKLDRRLDVVDFGTPVTFVDTSRQGNNTRITVTAAGDYEHLAYQSENVYVLEVKKAPENKQEKLALKERTYQGQKVSFNFQNIEVRSALMLLADLPGLNMVTSDAVTGYISLRLKNIPWDQALDIILESRGLGMRKVGNVIMVDRKENLAEREKRELEAQQEIKKLAPLRTQFVQINYSKAKELSSLLKTQGQHSFLSERGSVSIDERTNTIIIQDTADRLDDINALINSLDKPVRQVLIESKVVIANSDFSKNLGVKFGYSANEDLGNGNGVVLGGKTAGDINFSGGTAFTSGGTENLIVSLPATPSSGTAAAVGLAIGKIGSYLLQLELSALQTEGRGEVISNPRVITANQKKATIIQGQQIPYQTVTGVGANATAAISFKDAVLKLEVTPQITPDDRVIMDLVVSKDAAVPLGNDIAINKREVTTQVLVDNGETVVLGGVYEQTQSNDVVRVPFLSDLPFVGDLFKRRSVVDNKNELLIFVTPRILKGTST